MSPRMRLNRNYGRMLIEKTHALAIFGPPQGADSAVQCRNA